MSKDKKQDENKEKASNEKQIKEINNKKWYEQFLVKEVLLAVFISIATFLVTNGVVSSQQTRANKIQIISDLTECFTDYYFYCQVRSMIHFEKYEFGKCFTDSIFTGVQKIELPISKRLELEEFLRKTYPTAYDLMLERGANFPVFSKNLMLAKICFSDNVRKMALSFEEKFIPIDNEINKKVEQNRKDQNYELTEQEKNSILVEVFDDFSSTFFKLINQMNNEK